ncbi:hypothetical protein BGZ49_000911 [Haplosporangium sp. Z 27]|nr:hypothetical protein BGZ49_000911 [Haplosporangium sp. Z 27]
MVEEEELAYQIDAAATARLAQQQHYHHRTQLQKQQQQHQPFNKYTFPMPHEHSSSTSFPSRSFNDRNFVHPTALTMDDLELGNISLPVKSGNIADSEDFDSDDEEDFEQKRRELEDLERQVALLGLDDFQDSSDAPDLQSRRSSHHEQYPKLHQQPKLQLQQQQQQKPQQRVLPPIQTTSIQKPPYQRKRQNSLTYEERKIQQSTCRQLSKPSSPVTPIASPISPLRGATVNFFDGIVLDEESSDDNDDSVVLSVAHRVSVRLQDSQGKGGNRNERSTPSWDRARGVSWSPLSKKLSPPTASLPEARLAITTMISAR